jgi:hypothetical protein
LLLHDFGRTLGLKLVNANLNSDLRGFHGALLSRQT